MANAISGGSADLDFVLPGFGVRHFMHHQAQQPIFHGGLDLALVDDAPQLEITLEVSDGVFLFHQVSPAPRAGLTVP